MTPKRLRWVAYTVVLAASMMPAIAGAVDVTFVVGDTSDSGSEKYKLQVGDIIFTNTVFTNTETTVYSNFAKGYAYREVVEQGSDRGTG